MYLVNDYVVYGSSGVCKILDIGTPVIQGIDHTKLYYTLQPVYSKGSIIYTLIDNERSIIRKLITKEEALKLIDDIPNIDIIQVSNDKMREMTYKEIMKKYDCRECLKIIKTLYLRNQQRLTDGKKIGSSDLKYLHDAEEFLYGELSLPLEIPKENMEDFITSRVNLLK